MSTKTKTKNTGALTGLLAPQKTRIFSINVTEKGAARIRIVNNAPQVEQEQRIRAD
jgi:hypothetical protein